MKAKFIYVFLTCLMIGGQFSLSAQNQVNKDKRQRHTPEQFMDCLLYTSPSPRDS